MLDVGENIRLQLKYNPALLDMYSSYQPEFESAVATASIRRNRIILCSNYIDVMRELGITEISDADAEILSSGSLYCLELLYSPVDKGLNSDGNIPVFYSESAFCINSRPFILYTPGCSLSGRAVSAAAVVYFLREPEIIERSQLRRYHGTQFRLNDPGQLREHLLDSGEYSLDIPELKEKAPSAPEMLAEWNGSTFLLRDNLLAKIQKSSKVRYPSVLMNITLDAFEKLFFQNLSNEESGEVDVVFVRNLIAVDEYYSERSLFEGCLKEQTPRYAKELDTDNILDLRTICMEYAAFAEKQIKEHIAALQERVYEKWNSNMCLK